mgnify:FL=1
MLSKKKLEGLFLITPNLFTLCQKDEFLLGRVKPISNFDWIGFENDKSLKTIKKTQIIILSEFCFMFL